MSIKDANIQLNLLAIICTLLTVFSFVYILTAKPESLRISRDGVPFFTPKVINPKRYHNSLHLSSQCILCTLVLAKRHGEIK